MAGGVHDRIDELQHLQRSIETQYLVLDTAADQHALKTFTIYSFPACILSL